MVLLEPFCRPVDKPRLKCEYLYQLDDSLPPDYNLPDLLHRDYRAEILFSQSRIRSADRKKLHRRQRGYGASIRSAKAIFRRQAR
jgi:hypothetical protein